MEQALAVKLQAVLSSPGGAGSGENKETAYIREIKTYIGQHQLTDFMARNMDLPQSLVDVFQPSPDCKRIIFQKNGIAGNFDRVSEHGMRYYCQHCFSKEDHTGCNTRFIRVHGICKKIVSSQVRELANQQALKTHFEAGSQSVPFLKLKGVILAAYQVLFKLALVMDEDQSQPIFATLNAVLAQLCREIPGFSWVLVSAFTEQVQPHIPNMPACSLLEYYYIINSACLAVPTEDFIYLASFMTIYPEFNQEALKCTFEYLLRTYLKDPTDFRMVYYQTAFKMVSFDSIAAVAYVRSANFLTLVKSLTKISQQIMVVPSTTANQRILAPLIFLLTQMNTLFETAEVAEALITNSNNLQAYLEFVLEYQYICSLDVKSEGYLARDIQNYQKVLEVHDSILLTVCTLISKLAAHPNKKEYYLIMLKSVTVLSEKYESSLLKTNRYSSFLTPTQRVFGMLVVACCCDTTVAAGGKKVDVIPNLDRTTVQNIVESVFSDKQKLRIFFTKYFREIIHSFGFCEEIRRRVWARFGDYEMHDLLEVYMKTFFMLYDTDLVFFKIALIFVTEDDLITMPKYYTSGTHFPRLFSQDLDQLIEDAKEDWFEKQSLLLKDFWRHLSFAVVDEISLANICCLVQQDSLITDPINKDSPLFNVAKDFAAGSVYCMGSCNTTKLNNVAFWFFPYRLAYIKFVQDEILIDKRTQICRLDPEKGKQIGKSLKLELFYRNQEVASEFHAKLFESNLDTTYIVNELKPPHFKLTSDIYARFMEKCKLTSSLNLLITSIDPRNPAVTDLLPIYLRLLNNFVFMWPNTDGRIRDRLAAYMRAHPVHTIEAHKDMDLKLRAMASQVCAHIKRVMPADTTMIMEESIPETLTLAEKRVSNEAAKSNAKQKMEEKLAKLKNKMKASQQMLMHIEEAAEAKQDPNQMEESQKVDSPEEAKQVCSFCQSELNLNTEEYTAFTYVHFVESHTEQKVLFPMVSSCGHILHKECFKAFSKTNKKQKHWKHESRCIQCKTLSNTLLTKKKSFVDFDTCKATMLEIVSLLLESNNKLAVEIRYSSCVSYLLQELVHRRQEYSLGFLLNRYLQANRLLLEHVSNLGLQAAEETVLHDKIDPLIRELVKELKGYLLAHKVKDELSKEKISLGNELKELTGAFRRHGLHIDADVLKLTVFLALLKHPNLETQIPEGELRVMKDSAAVQPTTLGFYHGSSLFAASLETASEMHQEDTSETQTFLDEKPGLNVVAVSDGVSQTPFGVAASFDRFVDLLNYALKKACLHCSGWPKGDVSPDLLVCLLCDAVICQTHCATDLDDLRPNAYRNEHIHASTHHGGRCLYVSTISGSLLVCEHPAIISTSSFYEDEFGVKLDKYIKLENHKLIFHYAGRNEFRVNREVLRQVEVLHKNRLLVTLLSSSGS